MTEAHFDYDGPTEDIEAAITDLANAMSGDTPDHSGAADHLKMIMAKVLFKEIQHAYEVKSLGGADAMGIVWPPLAPSTLEKKRRAGKPTWIMRWSDDLYHSLDPLLAGTGKQVIKLLPGVLEIDSNIDYLKYHQSAAPRKVGKNGLPILPRRQVYPDETHTIPADWLDKMIQAVAAEMSKRSFWQMLLGQGLT